MIRKEPDSTQINQNQFNLINNLLVSLMMVCVSLTVILFVQKIIPDWNALFLPIVIFFVSLERLTTFKKVQRLTIFTKPWFLFHISQWVGILIILKTILLFADPPESWRMLFQLWRIDFSENFFDTAFLLSTIFVIVIWLIAGYFASLMKEMSLEEVLLRYETAILAPAEGPPARERLLGSVFGLGFVLVILTALMRVNFRMLIQGEKIGSLGIQPLPYLAAGAWNVLFYFLLGLSLVSISQLARLNARWYFQKIKVSPKLVSKWAIYSITFILLLSVVASLLPTNYSLGFLSVIAYILKLIWSVVYFVFGILLSILIFLIGQLARLFGVKPVENEPLPPPDFIIPEVPTEMVPTGADPWLDLVKSLVFWLVFVGVAGFSMYQFLRQHEGALKILREMPGLNWLMKVWQWLSGVSKGINHRISKAVTSSIERIRSRGKRQATPAFGRILRLRSLTPRQRIYYFFFAMLQKGEVGGLKRGDAQTPHEYAHILELAVPDVDDEIAHLTDAFVEARYSRKDVDDERAGIVKRYWGRIRAALRSIRF